MYAKTLVVAAFTGLAAADFFHEAMHRRNLVEVEVRQIINRPVGIRQAPPTPSIDMTCITALLSIESSLPTPPPALLSYEMTASVPSDPCAFTPPGDLGPAYSSYSKEIISWYSAHSAELSSALAHCPTLSGFDTATDNFCASTPPAAGKTTNAPAGKTTGPAATDAAGTTGSSGTGATSVSKAGAPRETGMAVAAIAAVGLLGAVAAM